jgi:hypothetical protein
LCLLHRKQVASLNYVDSLVFKQHFLVCGGQYKLDL